MPCADNLVTDDLRPVPRFWKKTTIEAGQNRDRIRCRGSESFGSELHLLFELALERKAKREARESSAKPKADHPRRRRAQTQTWAPNGGMIRWSGETNYQPAGYAQV